MAKAFLIIIQFVICTTHLFGQTRKSIDNKVYLDSITTKFLVQKTWYNVTPNFRVEQPQIVEYYINGLYELKDTSNYLGKLTFRADGTYQQTNKLIDTTIVRNGTWSVSSLDRELKLTFSFTLNEKEVTRTWTWFIFDLTSSRLVMQAKKVY